MPAVACLRVLVDGNRTDVPAAQLGPLVAKYANLFLEVRWTYPRQSEPLTHYCYLLSDPQVTELDTGELALMSQELQTRLFGTGEEGDVKLVLFEGDEAAIATFARYSNEDVVAAMEDPSGLPETGRLRRIAADGSLVDVPESLTNPPTAEAFRFGPTIDGSQGVYFPPGGAFIGDVLTCTPVDSATHYSMVDGEAHRPADAEAYDAACVMTAVRYLVDFPSGSTLYVPVSFSTLVRPRQRAAWLDLAAVLPLAARQNLSACVYDVPRAPTYQALKGLRAVLLSQFGAVDLCVRDPDFQIQQLTDRAVSSVTLALPEGKPDVRLAALRRFASHSLDYRKRRIAAGVTNIRFRTERELALELRIPFLSGPAVCRIQSAPVGGQSWPPTALPYGTQQASLAQPPQPPLDL